MFGKTMLTITSQVIKKPVPSVGFRFLSSQKKTFKVSDLVKQVNSSNQIDSMEVIVGNSGKEVVVDDDEKFRVIASEEQLQPEWASLERRVKERPTKQKGDGPHGRTSLRPGSAFDAENI